MLQYLLMCKSLTYAQRASRALERLGITAIITKAPKSVTGQGCSYCVKVSEKNLVRSLSILKDAGLGPVRVFLVSYDGSVSEVQE
ncbi:MAG: DUF3343 domain-containing protein [Clostridiales bacterium]|nr:DUF3343 domain-containing protein [Clostridiales bacterium]